MSDEVSSRQETHRVLGVMNETAVVCEHDGGKYGPGGDREPHQCPYCGEDAYQDGHEVILNGDEVLCPNTGQSKYRYCPGCGAEVGA